MLVWNSFQNDARVLKEAQTLARAGYRVSVHALMDPGITPTRERHEQRLQVFRVSKLTFPWGGARARNPGMPRRKSLPGKIWQIARRSMAHLRLLVSVLRQRPDVVHGHDANTLPTAWLAARLSGARLVYDAHEISVDREGYQGWHGLIHRVEKTLAPRADLIITTSPSAAKIIARLYRVARPLALENRPRFTPGLRSARLRDQLGIPAEIPIVLYQGGLQSGRGLQQFVQAATHLPLAHFVLLGDGRMRPALESQIRASGAQDRIHLLAAVPLADLKSYTASADIGVQPLERSCLNHLVASPNKLFEYIHAGLPVVASDLPEIRRVIAGNDLGVLFAPGDAKALQTAIGALLDNPEECNRISANAARLAPALAWDRQEQSLLRAYAKFALL